jgi:intracellular multiplication protein IcmO
MAVSGGIERNQEVNSAFLARDVRPLSERAQQWMTYPQNSFKFWIATGVALIVLPFFWLPILVIFLTFRLFHINWLKERKLPIRYPSWTKKIDPSTSTEDGDGKKKKRFKAGGIAFLGNERGGRTVKGGDEVWESDSDLRTHRLLMATTGGGKTNTLMSICSNALCWGSGFFYSDGKAQNNVFITVSQMMDMFWRQEDLLVINFMKGGADPFEKYGKFKKADLKEVPRDSNTFNPIGRANHETVNQLMSSIMPKAGGDGAIWQTKAINMMLGVVQSAAYLRTIGVQRLSFRIIRENIALANIIKLARPSFEVAGEKIELPEEAVDPLRAYLAVGLPGFTWKTVLQCEAEGKPFPSQMLDQHGYLTGQFTRTLSMMTDTYGGIFLDSLPEVDMMDVIINNRVLFVMIPSLEKSSEETASLGKLVVAAAKQMMAVNLGDKIEGNAKELVEDRPTNTFVPYEFIMDELGYYFAEGIDLMFAQGRSLGIALTASGQDFQAMTRNPDNKSGVESMLANTRTKIALANEDVKETFEVMQKAAGQAMVAEVDGFDMSSPSLFGNNAPKAGERVKLERRDRITLDELQGLSAGDGVLLYAGRVIRIAMFNMFLEGKDARGMPLGFIVDEGSTVVVNTLLPVELPTEEELMAYCHPKGRVNEVEVAKRILKRGVTPEYKEVMPSRAIQAMSATTKLLKEDLSPSMRGIALFMSALDALEEGRNEEARQREIDKIEELKNIYKNMQEPVELSEESSLLDPTISTPSQVADIDVNDWLNSAEIYSPADADFGSVDTEFGSDEHDDVEPNVVFKKEVVEAIQNFEEMAKQDPKNSARARGNSEENLTKKVLHQVEQNCEFINISSGQNSPPPRIKEEADFMLELDELDKLLS